MSLKANGGFKEPKLLCSRGRLWRRHEIVA